MAVLRFKCCWLVSPQLFRVSHLRLGIKIRPCGPSVRDTARLGCSRESSVSSQSVVAVEQDTERKLRRLIFRLGDPAFIVAGGDLAVHADRQPDDLSAVQAILLAFALVSSGFVPAGSVPVLVLGIGDSDDAVLCVCHALRLLKPSSRRPANWLPGGSRRCLFQPPCGPHRCSGGLCQP